MSLLGGAAGWGWANREEIGKQLKRLYGWFRESWSPKKGNRGILILGPGGAGKSTLGKLLSGNHDWLLDNPGQYEESIGVENYKTATGTEFEIVVPPGQKHRRDTSWDGLHSDIAAGRFRGIIIIAAYGYDSLGNIRVKQHKLYSPDRDDFLERYLDDRRKDELNILRALSPYIRACPKKLWVLALVSKQDLWWPIKDDVERYYTKGAYGKQLAKAANADNRLCRTELVFSSLAISNFVTAKGECLQNNAAGYDHQLHVESLRRLLQTVDSLKNWED